MKKMKLTIVFLFVLFTAAICQEPDHDFTVPIKVVSIVFPDGSVLNSAELSQTVTWSSVQDKPELFPPTAHRHSYNDLDDLPGEVELKDALNTLDYLPVPGKTTAEINSLVPTGGAIVYDKTLNVYKVWKGYWSIIATTQ